jgi:hypothetical protein
VRFQFKLTSHWPHSLKVMRAGKFVLADPEDSVATSESANVGVGSAPQPTELV